MKITKKINKKKKTSIDKRNKRTENNKMMKWQQHNMITKAITIDYKSMITEEEEEGK